VQQNFSNVASRQLVTGQSSVVCDSVTELEQLMKDSQSKITVLSFTAQPTSTTATTIQTSVAGSNPTFTCGSGAFVFQQPAAPFCEFSCDWHITFND